MKEFPQFVCGVLGLGKVWWVCTSVTNETSPILCSIDEHASPPSIKGVVERSKRPAAMQRCK